MTDVPTLTSATAANYCVLNTLDKSGTTYTPTISNGNLSFAAGSTGQFSPCRGTQFVSSGKWYFETTITNNGTYSGQVGVANNYNIYQSGGDNSVSSSGGVGAAWDGRGFLYYTGNNTAFTPTFTTNDVISCAFDADTGKIWFRKNGGSWYDSSGGTTGDPATGANAVYTYTAGTSVAPFVNGVSPHTQAANFGQRPFTYTPPSGFVALNTFNLPTPAIGATPATTANKYFDINTYTGDGSQTASFTNSGSMQPDMVWSRIRSGTPQAIGVFDSVRGTTGQSLDTAATTAEGTWNGALSSEYGYVSAFNSNGFSVNDGSVATTGGYVNFSGRTYVGWQWRASNATAVTNTAGTITSTVSANTSAGFSIVTYTGTGANATVGHGLGVAPSMIIARGRSAGTDGFNWRVYHGSLAATAYLEINTTSAQQTDATVWNSTAPTSSVFSLGTSGNVNGITQTYVAYCFAQIAGYSAFGSYTGNGSSDGPFVFTGFRPRYVLIKTSSAGTNGWQIRDTSRSPYNTSLQLLYADTSNAEISSAGNDFDILSNGFKVRNSGGDLNTNGGTYIYMAFCESPFKYALAR
jgi:hypothetical protein